jgi:excisionase family DNA binding protein
MIADTSASALATQAPRAGRQGARNAHGTRQGAARKAPQPGEARQSAGTVAAQPAEVTTLSSRARHQQSTAPEPVVPRLLTYQQAADYLAVSYWTVRSWAEAGRLAVVRLPGSRLLRIERTAIDQFVDAHRLA